jgi:hypothetical protein
MRARTIPAREGPREWGFRIPHSREFIKGLEAGAAGDIEFLEAELDVDFLPLTF